MADIPPFQHAWTTFQAHTQTPDIGIIEAINIMQKFDYPPPPEYEFVNQLGAGGCGKVYFAKHCSTCFVCAVKCVKIIDKYTAGLADGLWKEVLILNAYPHPNIIKCYGATQLPTDSSTCITYLFLEYMEMGSVRHLYSNPTIFTNETLVRECISQVLHGLVHLHAVGIIHRDLKGDNVLSDSEGVYKIADFGLSKRCNLDSSSGIYSLMTAGVGTPSHIAPEVKNPTGNVQYDTKADIWSLGCLVLEISNRGPVIVNLNMANQLAEYNLPTSITPQCADFIQCCLRINPASRPTSSCLLNHPWLNIKSVN